MKQHIIKHLQYILGYLARAIIKKYGPSIVAVTGSVGKTSTKEAIYCALKNFRNVRRSSGSFNNELGVPLTIIGNWEKIEGVLFWPKVICRALWQLVVRVDYPEILVIEYGIQKPGDMDALLRIAKPSVAVLTALGEVPAHLEFFSDADAVAIEKGKLLRAVPAKGFVVGNNDDASVMRIVKNIHAHVATFGFNKRAGIVLSKFTYINKDHHPEGISLKLVYGRQSVVLHIEQLLGKSNAYAIGAAVAVGLVFGGTLERIAQSLEKDYRGIKHRMNLINIKSGVYVVDDTYNASPLSMENAFEAIGALEAKRKIGVLGEMRELGGASKKAHNDIGRAVAKLFDVLLLVGDGGQMIGDGISLAKKKKKLQVINVECADKAAETLKPLLKHGDLVLIKASRAVGLDSVVDSINRD